MTAGRPTPYRPELAEQARKLCRNGLTDREVADILGISVRTFYRWRGEHDEFAEAVVVGKERADQRVESALYQRACGYDYEDVKIFHPSGAKDPVIVPVTVHVPADVAAARHWLAVRRPQSWVCKSEKEEKKAAFNIVDRLQAALDAEEERAAQEYSRNQAAVTTRGAEGLARHGSRAEGGPCSLADA
jgi:hypothetical protein